MCGYDSAFSLKEIKQNNVTEIEKYLSDNCMNQIRELDCRHSDHYKKQTIFKFLPGHETFILILPKHISKYEQARESKVVELKGRYSFILEEMIATAEANLFKHPSHARYPDSIRFFATAVFLLSGKSVYELLRANLPLPSVKTICKS